MDHNHRRVVDAVLFDLGSTLMYFDGNWPEIVMQADEEMFSGLEAAGLRLDRQKFLQSFRLELEKYHRERESEFVEYTTLYVLRSLLAGWDYADVDERVLRSALDRMYAVSQAYWTIEHDTLETLQTLQNQGYRLGLISNAADDADVQILIDQIGVRSYFETILTSAAQGIRKPNPAIFHEALKQIGVLPARAAMVGDTLGADILGARHAGMYSIWITRRADTPANRAHAGTIHPHAVIDTLSELPAVLLSLGENAPQG